MREEQYPGPADKRYDADPYAAKPLVVGLTSVLMPCASHSSDHARSEKPESQCGLRENQE